MASRVVVANFLLLTFALGVTASAKGQPEGGKKNGFREEIEARLREVMGGLSYDLSDKIKEHMEASKRRTDDEFYNLVVETAGRFMPDFVDYLRRRIDEKEKIFKDEDIGPVVDKLESDLTVLVKDHTYKGDQKSMDISEIMEKIFDDLVKEIQISKKDLVDTHVDDPTSDITWIDEIIGGAFDDMIDHIKAGSVVNGELGRHGNKEDDHKEVERRVREVVGPMMLDWTADVKDIVESKGRKPDDKYSKIIWDVVNDFLEAFLDMVDDNLDQYHEDEEVYRESSKAVDQLKERLTALVEDHTSKKAPETVSNDVSKVEGRTIDITDIIDKALDGISDHITVAKDGLDKDDPAHDPTKGSDLVFRIDDIIKKVFDDMVEHILEDIEVNGKLGRHGNTKSEDKIQLRTSCDVVFLERWYKEKNTPCHSVYEAIANPPTGYECSTHEMTQVYQNVCDSAATVTFTLILTLAAAILARYVN